MKYLILFIFLPHLAIGQSGFRITGKPPGELKKTENECIQPTKDIARFFKMPLKNHPSPGAFLFEKPAAPLVYSYCDLAFFCKLEVKMEKAVRLPVKIRLGDVQYVDWLEGKISKGWNP